MISLQTNHFFNSLPEQIKFENRGSTVNKMLPSFSQRPLGPTEKETYCLNLHNACGNAILVTFRKTRERKKKKTAWESQGRLQEAANICSSSVNVRSILGQEKEVSVGSPRQREEHMMCMLSMRQR